MMGALAGFQLGEAVECHVALPFPPNPIPQHFGCKSWEGKENTHVPFEASAGLRGKAQDPCSTGLTVKGTFLGSP